MFLLTTNLFAEDVKVLLTVDNTISLNDSFYGESVANLTLKAKELDDRIKSNDPIYLVINSPGGSIEDGLELIQNLSSLRWPIKTITLFAASMGFQTVQGLGERLITKNGTLMSHKAKGGFFGEFPGQLDSRYSYYLKRVAEMEKVAVARTKGKHTLKSYRNLIENEFWCSGKDCIKGGFADRIVSEAVCDKSLSGTIDKVYDRFLFNGKVVEILVTMDVCPLNTNMLKYNVYVDGKPLYSEANNTMFTRADNIENINELEDRVNTILKNNTNKSVIKGY